MAEPRGAGRAGGILFLVVAAFVGFLILKAAIGFVFKLVLTIAVIAILVALISNILRRR